MALEKGDFIHYTYKDEKGDQYIVPSMITALGEESGKFFLRFDESNEVDQSSLSQNTDSNFYINPVDLLDNKRKHNARNFLIDRLVSVLGTLLSEAKVERYMETITIHIESSKTMENLTKDDIADIYSEKVEAISEAIPTQHFKEKIPVIVKVNYSYSGIHIGSILI